MTTTLNNISSSLTQLFFHISNRDGKFDKAEIDFLSDKFVRLGFKDSVDFKKEIINYNKRAPGASTDSSYLQQLLNDIRPVNVYGLYSICIEIALSDGLFSAQEDNLLNELAVHLGINNEDASLLKKTFVERSVAENEGIF